MKNLLSLTLSILMIITLLTSCADKTQCPEITPSTAKTDQVTTGYEIFWDEPISKSEADEESDNERFVLGDTGQFQIVSSDEIKLDSSKLNIAGGLNALNLDVINQSSETFGLECEFTTFFTDEIALKIMAGDSDVDVYLLDASTLSLFIEKGIYHPLESDIIKEFNNGCFDYISDVAKDSNGQTVAMPLSLTPSFVAYPQQAADELGFDESNIAYYDDFHALINNYEGERNSFAIGDTLMSLYGLQYEEYYCDFKNKVFDYDTDLYKDIYKMYGGWQRYGQTPVMTGFIHPFSLGADSIRLVLDSENTLFTTTSSYDNFIFASIPDPFAPNTEYDINDWHAVHIPWISEEVDTNDVNVTYTFVNPYSKHYDEAVKLFEYIAQNYFDSVTSYSFIREDISGYPEIYRTETALFDDVYDICKNGFVTKYSLYSSRIDIDEYQNGRATLDEAIAMYQREVEIWLNE